MKIKCLEDSWLYWCGINTNKPFLLDFVNVNQENNRVIVGLGGHLGWYDSITGKLIKEIPLPAEGVIAGLDPYSGHLIYVLKSENKICDFNIEEESTICLPWKETIKKNVRPFLLAFPQRKFFFIPDPDNPKDGNLYELSSELEVTRTFRRSRLPGRYILYADERQVIMENDSNILFLDGEFNVINQISLETLKYQLKKTIREGTIDDNVMVFAGPNMLRILLIVRTIASLPIRIMNYLISKIVSYEYDEYSSLNRTIYVATYNRGKTFPAEFRVKEIPVLSAKIGWDIGYVMDNVTNTGVFYGDCKGNLYAVRINYSGEIGEIPRIVSDAKIKIP